jgi:hypothetical protein
MEMYLLEFLLEGVAIIKFNTTLLLYNGVPFDPLAE